MLAHVSLHLVSINVCLQLLSFQNTFFLFSGKWRLNFQFNEVLRYLEQETIMAVQGIRENSEIPRIPYSELALEEFQVSPGWLWANLNKSEFWWQILFTEVSKYIPKSKSPKICINWYPPPFQTSLHKFFKNCFLWSKSYLTTFTFRGTFIK